MYDQFGVQQKDWQIATILVTKVGDGSISLLETEITRANMLRGSCGATVVHLIN